MRVISIALTSFILFGCATALNRHGERVQISPTGLSFIGCRDLGPMAAAENDSVNDRQSALNKLRNSLGEKGGNWLIIVNEESQGNAFSATSASVQGHGFYCPPKVIELVKRCDSGNGRACRVYAQSALKNNDLRIYRNRLNQACENDDLESCDLLEKEDKLSEQFKAKCEFGDGDGDACASYAYRLGAMYGKEPEANFYAERGCELKSVTACKYVSLVKQFYEQQGRDMAQKQIEFNAQMADAHARQADAIERAQKVRALESMSNALRSPASVAPAPTENKKLNCNSSPSYDITGKFTGYSTECR